MLTPKLFYEVKALCYKAKRGIQTEHEFTRFMGLLKKYGGDPDFEKARLEGHALAMSEVNPSLDFSYWVKRLSE